MSDLYLILILSSYNVLFLIVWFQTNAVYEYLKVLKFNKVKFLDESFGVTEYEEFLRISKKEVLYSEYTEIINDNFFGRLTACPVCISFWIQFPLCFLSPAVFPASVLSTLMIYNLYLILQKNGSK
tara:strand:- start:110 stop:487 length:378 start_codon:yes stop_codon:yes gene_type:complete